MTIRQLSCCGLRELSGLQGPDSPRMKMKEFIRTSCPRSGRYDFRSGRYSYVGSLRFSHVIFSEARDGAGDYGERFAAFIRRNKLGDVVASLRRVNPNSGNQVKCWVWTLNKPNLMAWANKNIDVDYQFGIAND